MTAQNHKLWHTRQHQSGQTYHIELRQNRSRPHRWSVVLVNGYFNAQVMVDGSREEAHAYYMGFVAAAALLTSTCSRCSARVTSEEECEAMRCRECIGEGQPPVTRAS